VLDGTDNFASRFLLADAGVLAGVPVVHAASVRWRGTCFVGGGPGGGPCYRCLFEDLPEGPAPDCAGAGVVGPVCGVVGAIAADAVISVLEATAGQAAPAGVLGTIASFDGLRGAMRRVRVERRAGCALCGASPDIRSLDRARYVQPSCESAG
jgi:molybdopterin/thiamine biosynthesis adenylyltransferase